MGIRALAMLGLIAIALCAFGAQFTYVGLRDGKQLEVTCTDYVRHRPDSRWLKLTACQYDFQHLAFQEDSRGKAAGIYLPLRPARDKTGPTRIVVKLDDKDARDVAWVLEHSEDTSPEIDRVLTDLLKPKEGLVQFGLELDAKERERLSKLGLGLADDFVILEQGAKPRLAYGIMLLVAGLVGVVGLAIAILRRLRPAGGKM